MLPFLKPKSAPITSSVIEAPGSQEEKGTEDQGLIACMHDLITAIHDKDSRRAAQAFKDAFSLCELMPHEEYEDLYNKDEDLG